MSVTLVYFFYMEMKKQFFPDTVTRKNAFTSSSGSSWYSTSTKENP